MPVDHLDSIGKSDIKEWFSKKFLDAVSDIHQLQFSHEQVAETLNALRSPAAPAIQKQALKNIDVITDDLDWAVGMSAQPLQKKDMRSVSAHAIIKEVQRGLKDAGIHIADLDHDGQLSPSEVQKTFRDTVSTLSKPQR